MQSPLLLPTLPAPANLCNAMFRFPSTHLVFCVLPCVLASCGGGEHPGTRDGGAVAASGAPSEPSGEPSGEASTTRSMDPRLAQAREALDLGELERAQALVPMAAEIAGPEGLLLRARLAALAGERFEALKWIEDARSRSPHSADVYATAAELHAAAGQLTEADLEIRRGIEAAGGVQPELIRARGVQLICNPGQVRAGLELLEQARALDPDLPFMERALGQAYMLLAKQQLASGANALALGSVRRSLEHDPEEIDARRLHAEVLMVVGEWGAGIRLYEELLVEGQSLEAELSTYYKNAGFWAVTSGQRELGVEYYLRALELGFPREQLGHGLTVLAEEASELTTLAAEDLLGEQLEPARERLQRALLMNPDSIEARNYLGHVQHSSGQLEEAATSWAWVVDTGRSRRVELPEPVHILLAKVQALGLGRFGQARETLEAYLVLEPTGRWTEDTRALLAALPEPPAEEDQGPGARDQEQGAGGGGGSAQRPAPPR